MTALAVQHTIDSAIAEISELDFSDIRSKLADTEEGKGWDLDHCEAVEAEYRRYLALSAVYPQDAIVPSKPVDEFWHYHILDTQAYERDCKRVFGYFLHHYPYFGMRGEEDAAALGTAYDETLRRYEHHFGSPPSALWAREGMSRCPNCGRKCR